LADAENENTFSFSVAVSTDIAHHHTRQRGSARALPRIAHHNIQRAISWLTRKTKELVFYLENEKTRFLSGKRKNSFSVCEYALLASHTTTTTHAEGKNCCYKLARSSRTPPPQHAEGKNCRYTRLLAAVAHHHHNMQRAKTVATHACSQPVAHHHNTKHHRVFSRASGR
jgi:hypothetical protein